VAPAVDLRMLKPGTRVDFTIEQGDGGNYVIRSVKPAGGGG
jgi:cold shock CspA family protein